MFVIYIYITLRLTFFKRMLFLKSKVSYFICLIFFCIFAKISFFRTCTNL